MSDRYWVGGTATWDATAGTKWALTSGGAGGQPIPTAADDVFIDSGSGAVTVTASTSSACRNLSFVSGSGSFAGSFAGSAAFSVSGGLTLSAAMTCTYTGIMSLIATTGGNLITSNGKVMSWDINLNGVGGGWQLQDDASVTQNSNTALTLTNGALDLNGKVFSVVGRFSSSNSNTRSIAFGATGEIRLTGSSLTVFNMGTSTGFSYTGSGLINLTYAGAVGTRTITGQGSGATEANSLNYKVSAGTDIVSSGGSCSFGNLDFTGFSGTLGIFIRTIYGSLTISSGMTLTAGTNATTFASTNGTPRIITTNGKTLDFPLAFDGVGGAFSFADALTQGSTRAFTLTNGIVKLKAGVTSTVGALATSGSNQKSLQSTTPGSQATLSQASGTVTVTRLTIRDVNATGGATFNALRSSGNVDGGDNAGWNFGLPIGTGQALSLSLGLRL